ncbi:hypothetical protein L3Y34_010191 [Caenorhabditis briggsae]|uniref:Protein kinase domain-containing protein n=1 Tax=Caenorhabditis briggsae TaxID=6238 RepID=A0AAE8ZJM2_CAEBR|nr:hypothetical protein L3Y34_010191 [Caenorhabditis briggsae]
MEFVLGLANHVKSSGLETSQELNGDHDLESIAMIVSADQLLQPDVKGKEVFDQPDNDENMLPEQMNVDHFLFLKHIGNGAYGEVAAVEKKTGKDKGTIYAMKAMEKKKMGKHKEMVDHEWRILTTIDSPFFMTMKYAFQSARHILFVMPLAGGGDLLTNIEMIKGDKPDDDKNKELLKDDQAFFYLCELVEAVGYLHKKQIVHRDIKLENLLVANDGHLLVTDYGLSATGCDSDTSVEGTVGTRHVMAPEIFQKQCYGPASDWWSVGITLCDMRSGRSVFNPKNSSEIEYSKSTCTKRARIPVELNQGEREFVKKLLVADPVARIGYGTNGTDDIKKQFLFRNVNWEDVLAKKLIPPFVPNAEQIRTFECLPCPTNSNWPTFIHATPLYWDDIDYVSSELL